VARKGLSHHHYHHHAVRELGSLLPSFSTSLEPLQAYQLTWHDEFEYSPYHDLPSSENWIFDLGTQYPVDSAPPKWGNNEAEIYTNSPANVHITSSGTLAITPRLSSNGTWTSARIETQRKDFAATPGGKLYIESRLRTGCAPSDRQQGIWPAFWALGADFRPSYTGWPAVSEWDFLEVVNGLPTVYSTIHCGYAPGGPCNEYNGIGNGGVDWSGCDWHTIGFEVDRCAVAGKDKKKNAWKNETLSWYLDGKKTFEVSGSRFNDSATWEAIAHQGHFLLLNVAVGGNWPGQPNNATLDGEAVQMEVDYIRVWNSY
jgi:beta-glucanase (GH16 family)